MGPKAASVDQTDRKWVEMENISERIHTTSIESEEVLEQINKGPLVQFTVECEDDQKVNRVFRSLLKTFSAESISQNHLASACNALSAFLDAALASKNDKTKQLVFSSENWLAVFEVYLRRFEHSNPKPLKQLLVSIMKVLVKQKQETESRFIQSKFGDATISCLILGEPRSQRRAALVAWESFIRKSAFSSFDAISMVRNWLLENHEKWLPLFEKNCRDLGIDSARFVQQSSRDGDFEDWSGDIAVKLLVQGLLAQARNMEAASLAGSVINSLLGKMRTDPYAQYLSTEGQGFSPIWAPSAKRIMLQNLDMLDSLSNYVLHPLFTVDPSGFLCFVDQLPVKSLLTGDMADAPLEEFIVLFAALQTGKKIGLVQEDHYVPKANSSGNRTYEPLVLNSEIVGKFLLHRETSIRLAALSLLTMAISTTKPLMPSAASAIVQALPSMHADSDAYSRWRIWSLTQTLLVRLKGGGVLKNQSEPQSDPADSKPRFERSDDLTREYLQRLIESLCADLQPTASYQRHITSLKSLAMVLKTGLDPRVNVETPVKSEKQIKWRFHIDILRPSLLRVLINLLIDSFDDVRATALSVLNMFPADILLSGPSQTPETDGDSCPRLIDALARAESVASNTSRADHADTVARLYHVLFYSAKRGMPDEPESRWWLSKVGVVDLILRKVEVKLSLSGGLFNSSMRDAPLHGYLSGLRYIASTPDFYSSICGSSSTDYSVWRSLHTRIVSICNRIWHGVKPVLCIDSPEGHTDEPVEDLLVGPKDILSYSWRALRESSLLLHATLANSTYGPKGNEGLKKVDYENIGSTSFIQLAELRHRGAFSTVSQTFATCCQRCSQSNDPAISSLLEVWYQEANRLIFEAASKLTRRSAGLPALITGILSSDPGSPLLHRVMKELHDISRLTAKQDEHDQEMELPQVHAMNCLKDIFTNAKLGPHTNPFIMSALTLSAERIGSSIWALRNAGLMLFRAILIRICRVTPGTSFGFGGSSGSEPGARVSFEKYPGLSQLLSRLLEPPRSAGDAENEDNTLVTERVFPALELIGEKIPVYYSTDLDTTIRRLVLEQLKGPIWGVREHSARVYASLLNRIDILKEIRILLDVDNELVTQNYLHGKALCIRFALRRFACAHTVYWNGNIEEIISTIQSSFAVMFPFTISPFVAAALIEILNDAVEKSIESGVAGKMVPFLEDVFKEYGFYDILDYVLDSSHPSWKSINTTRASSLLRRVLSWTTILKMLTSSQLDSLEPFFHAVSAFDPNASQWLLERIQQVFGEAVHREMLSKLYSSVILGGSPEFVKIAAVSNLSSILEVCLDIRYETIKGIDLPLEELERQLESEASVQTWSREMTGAVLRLQGGLVTVKAISSQGQPWAEFESDLRRWAIRLRYAYQEETVSLDTSLGPYYIKTVSYKLQELTSRHAAVVSLSTFGRVLRPHGNPPRVDNVLLEIYLVLYDMLNDDDDEIRDVAAATASWVLSYSSVSASKSVALAPLNASKVLAEFIARTYAKSSVLFHRILQYISGQVPRISDPVGTGLIPVSDLIAEYRKESTVLFVEEKQNLFIDPVREIETWSGTLHLLETTSYTEIPLLGEVFEWVSEGLTYLSTISVGEAGSDGPLGWTSKPEIFTLVVQVINIAVAFSSNSFPASGLLGLEHQRTLRGKLELVSRGGTGACLNDEWLSNVQAVSELP